MEDIYQKALNGNRNSIRGIYVSSVTSAYSAVNKVVKEESKACEIVEEAYLSAFSVAKNYEEFFAHLNKRALAGCKYYCEDADITIDEIIAINTVYANLSTMPIPDELKSFDKSLCAMVSTAEDSENFNIEKTFDKSKDDGEDVDSMSESDILESVEKAEFSQISDFSPEKKEPPKTAAQNLSEKLKGTEKESSGEEKAKEKEQKSINKKTALIASVITLLFIIGAISGFFIARHKSELKKNEVTTVKSTDLEQVTKINKKYKESERYLAFSDYLNKVLIEVYGESASGRTIAYTDAGEVGIERLNGIVSAKIADIDGDGKDEMLVVVLNVKNSANVFTYSYTLGVYAFEKSKVVPKVENYRLLENAVLNTSDKEYKLGDFDMFLRYFKHGGKNYIYAEAVSPARCISSYHYYADGEMHEGQCFIYYAFDESSYIYLQKKMDGTYLPVYYVYGTYPQETTNDMLDDYKQDLKTYGYSLAQSSVVCKNSKQLIATFNKAMAKTGLKLGFSTDISFKGESRKDYIVNLNSTIGEGDKLSRQAIIAIKDYSNLKKIKSNTYKPPKPTTTTTTEVVIPTTKPTTTAPDKSKTTKAKTKSTTAKVKSTTKAKSTTAKAKSTTQKASSPTKEAQKPANQQ